MRTGAAYITVDGAAIQINYHRVVIHGTVKVAQTQVSLTASQIGVLAARVHLNGAGEFQHRRIIIQFTQILFPEFQMLLQLMRSHQKTGGRHDHRQQDYCPQGNQQPPAPFRLPRRHFPLRKCF